MTSASPAAIKDTGAASANQEAVQAGQSSMGDTSRKIDQPMLQVTETKKVTGNEECSEWSDEEMRVLQVYTGDKGEVNSIYTPSGGTRLANEVRGRLKAHTDCFLGELTRPNLS